MTLRRIAAFAVLAAGCASSAAQSTPAHGTPAHGRPAHGKVGQGAQPPAAVVRVQILAGTPQSAHAYVAPAAPVYVTEFTKPLVVRIVGGKSPKPSVHFLCVTKGCELPPQVQPDDVKRVDPRTFEVPVKDGKATFSVTVSTDTPRTVEVLAEPVVGPGERAVRSGPFRLTAQ